MAKKKSNDTSPASIESSKGVPSVESIERIICRSQGVGLVLAKSIAAKIGPGQCEAVQALAASGAGAQEILGMLKSKPNDEETN